MFKKFFFAFFACVACFSNTWAQCTATITSSGSTSFCSGGSDTLTASAGNSYQWQLNGINLTDTNQTCVATVSGTYSVVVTNNSCTPTTSTASVVITVNSSPSITSQPSNDTVCTGGNASFTVVAGGSGLAYQWQVYNGSSYNNLSNFLLYSGTNTAVLTITGVLSTMTGFLYRCVISGVCTPTVTSTSVTLIVDTIPAATIISSGPTSFCSGGSDTLTASSGTSYQWQLNGVNILGSTSQTCVVTNAGNYTVVVYNGSCSATSSAVTITVNALPTATITASGPTTVCYGDSIDLCGPSGFGYLYQWLLNGINIPGATSQCYVSYTGGVFSVQVTDTSNCTAVSSTTTVTVNPLPTVSIISSQPNPNCVGNMDTLYVSGGLGYSYQWLYNGYNIQSATTLSRITDSGGIYTAVVVNSYGCVNSASDTIVFNSTPVPSITSSGGFCIGDTVTLSCTPAGATYVWSGPSSFSSTQQDVVFQNATASLSGTYVVSVTVPGCPAASSSISIVIASCDSVWPGDVNYDHVVDNTDALDLALAYGNTGSARTGASNSWVGQYCTNWGTNVVPGVDMKNADCDGNGTVNSSDTTAIAANYGLTHPKGVHHAQAKISGVPDLYFDFTGLVPMSGQTTTVPIKLGSASLPMNNILGFTAHVRMAGVSPSGPMNISYPISWLGSASNTFSFRKAISNNEMDWAYARNDHQNISGNGTIASLTFTLPPNNTTQQMVLYFEDVMIINNQGNIITSYNVLDDTVAVPSGVVCCVSPSGENVLNIVPNPSGAHAELQLFQATMSDIEVKIFDIIGKEVWTHVEYNTQGNVNVLLPAPAITSGIYMIQVKTGATLSYLKWIKN